MKRCLKVLLLAGGLVAGGSVMGQEAESGICIVKTGEGLKVFEKCKAGDVLVFEDFTMKIINHVCDFSKQITYDEVAGTPFSCVYIGYVRKKR